MELGPVWLFKAADLVTNHTQFVVWRVQVQLGPLLTRGSVQACCCQHGLQDTSVLDRCSTASAQAPAPEMQDKCSNFLTTGAQGGFSEVWLAKNKETGQKAAIKAVYLSKPGIKPSEVRHAGDLQDHGLQTAMQQLTTSSSGAAHGHGKRAPLGMHLN